MSKFVMIDRTGETNIAKNGQKMTIIACRGTRDIDIAFEDGTVVEHKRYDLFLNGTVCNPNVPRPNITRHTGEADRHIGKSKISKLGQKMTIVGYRNRNDVDILVDDVLYEHVMVKQFTNGVIGTRSGKNHHLFKDHSGEVNYNTVGLRMLLINYRNYNDIDVQFDDGTIIEHRSYQHFKTGCIENPKNSKRDIKQRECVGQQKLSKSGVRMILTDYAASNDVTVTFETGYTISHRQYGSFTRSEIAHPFPYILGSIIIDRPAYIYNDVGNFYCKCNKCGLSDIMDISEIKSHHCNN